MVQPAVSRFASLCYSSSHCKASMALSVTALSFEARIFACSSAAFAVATNSVSFACGRATVGRAYGTDPWHSVALS